MSLLVIAAIAAIFIIAYITTSLRSRNDLLFFEGYLSEVIDAHQIEAGHRTSW